MSFPSGLLPNQVFTLGFKIDEFTPGSLIAAYLMCSPGNSTLRDIQALGGSYGEHQMSPNSPTTSISVLQAKKALVNCPNNNFVLLYEYTPLDGITLKAPCSDNFSLQIAPTSSLPVPTGTATEMPPLTYTLSTPSPSTHTLMPIDPTPSGHNTPEDDRSTSPSIGLIIGASVGVVALIFVILVVLLVWRKRQQAQARIDYLFSDSLMASSGFKNDKPIYGRSDPNDDPSATHPPPAMDALVVPMNHDRYRDPRPRPGCTQIIQPPPQLPHAAAQHAHYRQQQHQQQQQQRQNAGLCHKYDPENCHKEEEELPPQQQPSYRLPYSQPVKDYKYPRGPQEESPPQRQPSYRLPYSQPAKDYKYPRGPQEESPQPSYRLPYSLPANDYDYPRGPQEESPPQRQPSYRLPYSQPPNDYNYPRGPQEESPQPSYRLPYSLPANDYDYPRGPQGMQ
ncbi:hypothetical protein BGZ67_007743 [Mortierella alpina]|nr:hypothetical protein BGZ67_007743 [Mortierella alpina]